MRAFLYTGGKVYPEAVTERPAAGDLVLAADAGFLVAQRFGITPQILLGDFDSLGEPHVPEGTELIRVPVEKDMTDTQLAVSHALSLGASEFVIVGGLDGRLDHTLSTLAVLEDLNIRKIPAVITSGKNRARFLRNNNILIPRGSFRYLAIIAVDPVLRGVTVEGCKYPLRNARLSRTNQYAISNELTGNGALIEIRRGGAFIIESTD